MNAEAHDAHLSRLREDDVPVSGRSEPRPAPDPDGFAHVMTVAGLVDTGGIRVLCTCRDDDGQPWRREFDAWHKVDDLTELKRQHCGDLPSPLGVHLCENSAGGLTCDLPYGHYAHHHASYNGHSITWPQNVPYAQDAPEPFGTESEPGR